MTAGRLFKIKELMKKSFFGLCLLATYLISFEGSAVELDLTNVKIKGSYKVITYDPFTGKSVENLRRIDSADMSKIFEGASISLNRFYKKPSISEFFYDGSFTVNKNKRKVIPNSVLEVNNSGEVYFSGKDYNLQLSEGIVIIEIKNKTLKNGFVCDPAVSISSHVNEVEYNCTKTINVPLEKKFDHLQSNFEVHDYRNGQFEPKCEVGFEFSKKELSFAVRELNICKNTTKKCDNEVEILKSIVTGKVIGINHRRNNSVIESRVESIVTNKIRFTLLDNKGKEIINIGADGGGTNSIEIPNCGYVEANHYY